MTAGAEAPHLLEVRELRTWFASERGVVRARHVPERRRVVLSRAGAEDIEVGRHLHAEARGGLADELNRTLSL